MTFRKAWASEQQICLAVMFQNRRSFDVTAIHLPDTVFVIVLYLTYGR